MQFPDGRKTRDIIDGHRPSLKRYESIYKDIHANPCLSYLERDTADLVAQHLSSLASRNDAPTFILKERIGDYGLCGILYNGKGPTILLRADMDALPVEERTGLPYASKKCMKDIDGIEQPVMHACGHDMHVASLLGAAELLQTAYESWSGTIVFCFQQAEERGGGAQRMVDAGMYDPDRHAVPVPDVVLGAHVMPLRAGALSTKPGVMMAGTDSFEVTLYGLGGHASIPETTVDPIVMAASTIMRLQTVVSREISPHESAVLSVTKINAGHANNIIPDRASFRFNVRSYSGEVREKVLKGAKRIINAESEASKAPKPPTVTNLYGSPPLANDQHVTAKIQRRFEEYFGKGYADMALPLQASEDFPALADAVGKPYCFWTYGGVDPDEWDRLVREGRLDELPSNHSPFFAPVIQPTLKTAVDAFAVAALTWLQK